MMHVPLRHGWWQRRKEWARRLHALRRGVGDPFLEQLIEHTGNFGHVTFLGHPIWQNVLDLWTIQETIAEVRPALLIECGTNRGGSAYFFATLFDLIGQGRVVTVDVESMHHLAHPRIQFLIGDSTSPEIVHRMADEAHVADGPVMVILDSHHARDHVARELELYAPLVTSGSFLLCQDGVIDRLESLQVGRPGPLPAIENFLAHHPEFEADEERCRRFLITHHPKGWLRRK